MLNLLKSGAKFKWGEEHENAFERIKKLFIKYKVLVFPDIRKSYILNCDASKFALGSILSQLHEKNKEKIITCICRTLRVVFKVGF